MNRRSPSASSVGSGASRRGGHTLVSSPASSRASSQASHPRTTTIQAKTEAAKSIINSYGTNTKKILADVRRARERLLALACHQGKSHNVVIITNNGRYLQKVTKEIVTSTSNFLQMLETMAKKRGASKVSKQKSEERKAALGETPEWEQIEDYVTNTTSYSPIYVLQSFIDLLESISSGLKPGTQKTAFDRAFEYIKQHHVSTRDTVQYLCSFIKHMNLDRDKMKGYYLISGNLSKAFNTRIVDDKTAKEIEAYLDTIEDSKKSKLLKEFPQWKNKTLFEYLKERPRPSGKGEMLAKAEGRERYVSTSAGFTIAVICTVPLAAVNQADVGQVAKAILSAVNVKKAKLGEVVPLRQSHSRGGSPVSASGRVLTWRGASAAGSQQQARQHQARQHRRQPQKYND